MMATLFASSASAAPAVLRLQGLADLGGHDLDSLRAAARSSRAFRPRGEIMGEGEVVGRPAILLSGWAYRGRTLSDGRRQILGFILPGDMIGTERSPEARAPATVTALTSATVCSAPRPRPGEDGSRLAGAFAVSEALNEAYLLRHVTRLGRMNAYERLIDWLLETYDRLALAGLVNGRRFLMPVTQETLADTLGLTSVHVNRTIQALRRDGLVEISGGTTTLKEPERLKRLVDYAPPRVARLTSALA